MKIDLNSLGKRIASSRDARGLTQEDLAHIMGITQQQVSYAEKGIREPRATLIYLFAQALGVSADYLLGLDEDLENG